MKNQLDLMDDAEHAEWLAQVGGVHGGVSEETLAGMVGDAIREPNPEIKSQHFLDIANMALALADKNRGSRILVTNSLVFTKH